MGHFISEGPILCLVFTGLSGKIQLFVIISIFHLYSLSFLNWLPFLASLKSAQFCSFCESRENLDRQVAWHAHQSTACPPLHFQVVFFNLSQIHRLAGCKDFPCYHFVEWLCFLCDSECNVIVAHGEMLLTLIYQN